jgi:AraC-like DNA-binding protein
MSGSAPEGAAAPFQRVMPDGRAELIFNLADPFEARAGADVHRQSLALLVGPSRRAIRIRPTGAVELIGVRFRPEAMSSWLRVGGADLVDGAFPLDEVPAPLERSLPQRLTELGTGEARLALLWRELGHARDRAPDRRVMAAVDLAVGGAGAAAVAAAVGLSHRQLDRVFRDRVGFGPKPLARLGRFQRALRALEAPGCRTVASAALAAGYFDQAHLNRDFRLFAGIAPGRYLREARELARHFIAGAEPTPCPREGGEFFQDLGRPDR